MSRMIPKSAVAFRPAQRDEKCRVCNTLEGIGDTKDLYDKHTQSVAVGCPRFATMSMEKKQEIVKEIKKIKDSYEECILQREKESKSYDEVVGKMELEIETMDESIKSNQKFIEELDKEIELES